MTGLRPKRERTHDVDRDKVPTRHPKYGYNRKMSATPKRRIYELDLLRGFFICVIILDHLQFWPSPLQYFTGQGRLWVSAAEGFFLISGLLIGYLRLYKGANTPLRDLTKILVKRGVMLYVWGVLITFIVVALSQLMPGDGALLPKMPDVSQTSSLPVYLWNVISTAFSSDWIYFLRMYAIMLIVTPLFLWLVRKGKWWVALLISLGLYFASIAIDMKEVALQWQILFFGAALIGWKLESILGWLRQRPRVRTAVITSLIVVTLSTMVLSYFMVHGWAFVERPDTAITREAYVSVRSHVDPWFSNNPIVPARIGLAFVWFSGLLALFHVLKPLLMRYASWLLLPFGQASLTAYCLQAVILVPIVSFIPLTKNYWLNGLIGVLVILLFAGLIRLRIVQRILPR